jgi:hypothetical protein
MKRLLWGLLLGGLSALSCGSSGQTGSAACVELYSCECQRVGNQYLARGTLVRLDEDGNGRTALVDIEAVLNPDAAFGPDDVHRQISGPATLTARDANGPCSSGAAQDPPRVGDEVLITFDANNYRQSYCEACDAECTAECIARASTVIQTSMVLTPWADDAVEVGNGTALSLSDAIELTNIQTCAERYPRAQIACNDTPSDESCALSAVGGRAGAPRAFLALLAIAAVLWRRRLLF